MTIYKHVDLGQKHQCLDIVLMANIFFASTFLIASFHGIHSVNHAGHSMLKGDYELSTSPNLSQAQSENVSESFEKIQKIKENTSLMQNLRKQKSKRDPNYVAWSSVTNNMDVLREHFKEKLYVEVERRHGGLRNIGKK